MTERTLPAKREERLEANRKNALSSTGPRTQEGKKAAAKNALKHGLLSMLRVLPAFEKRNEWASHLELTVQSLKPEGYMETVLAERIALQLVAPATTGFLRAGDNYYWN